MRRLCVTDFTHLFQERKLNVHAKVDNRLAFPDTADFSKQGIGAFIEQPFCGWAMRSGQWVAY
jgi:hypothetical protein